jgi:glutathione S-transferase
VAETILHHYPGSPYAEKVRLALGIKNVAWRSVTIPVIMPKPDLMPLTGGYRKTPVMQIGADVYCDTQLIVREIERRFPEPTFFPAGSRGLGEGLGWWAERGLFNMAVGLVFAKVGDQLPQNFRDDRAKFSGRDFNPERTKAAEPMMLANARAQLGWLQDTFADGRRFLFGDAVSSADCSLYHMVWFMRRSRADVLAEFPAVVAWADRMAAIGHGKPSEMDGKEALAIAKAATPGAVVSQHDGSGPALGARVTVTPDDSGRDPVAGELVFLSRQEIIIRRNAPETGELLQHFPRAGFVLAAAS